MTQTIEIAGLIVMFGVVAHVAVTLAFAVLRRARAAVGQQLELKVFREQTQVYLEAARTERDRTQLSWDGYRKFEVARKVLEAKDIYSFYLKPHDRQPLPSFDPGQHLTFQLRVPNQSKPVVRCYSLSDTPLERDHYRVTIKHIAGGDENPPGVASSYLCQETREGDIVDVQAPSGHFRLDLARDRPIVMIAGGVGLTPMLSMLLTICATGARREAWLFYGVRNTAERVMADELRKLAREYEHFHLVVCFSGPTDRCVKDRDYDHEGHVDLGLLQNTLPSNNYEFYICGPPPMMDAVVAGLKRWQVPEKDIFFEAFGAASARPVSVAASGKSFEVAFDRSGQTRTWTSADGSLLDLAEAHGIALDSGCRAGSCGSCITAIKEGEIDYTIDPGAHTEEGSCLACIAVPKSRVVLDA